MSACCFFGHKDTPADVKPALYSAIEELTTKYGVSTFYVGNQGTFDAYVRSTLRQLQEKYPHIRHAVVLAYMPGKQTAFDDFSDTLLPEGIEVVHPRYALDFRNRWMLRESQFTICYVHHQWGGAAKYVRMAFRQGKTVINLCSNGVLDSGL